MKEKIDELLFRSGVTQHSFSDPKHPDLDGYIVSNEKLNDLVEMIVLECIEKCEAVASDADFMTKSEFVTNSGRMLHEGMWGGATNCANEIREHFGIK